MADEVAFEPMCPEYIPAVIPLLQRHLQDIPPVHLSDSEIVAAIDDPGWFLRLHYPESANRDGDRWLSLVGRRGDEVIAAAQLLLPQVDRQAHLYWIAGLPDGVALTEFVRQMIATVIDAGYERIGDARNPFGIGWSGIPDSWPHVLEALRVNGFNERARWQAYWITQPPRSARLPEGVEVRAEVNEVQREVTVKAYAGAEMLGEVELWLSTPSFKTFTEAGLAAIEWIEVSEPQRGKGLGQALLSAAAREARRQGIRSYMLWTQADAQENNVAMQRLAEKAGFQRGPALHWIEYSPV